MRYIYIYIYIYIYVCVYVYIYIYIYMRYIRYAKYNMKYVRFGYVKDNTKIS